MSTLLRPQKKILDTPILGGIVIPLAIVLFGSLIIFGITQMLSNEKSYRDLIGELQSRSFGNKWVAAYELSKQINAHQIPVEEYPWVVSNLTNAYKTSADPRTRGFIIAAMGALKTEQAVPLLQLGLDDQDMDVKFHSIVAIASMPKGLSFDWSKLLPLLKFEKAIIRQATIFALATHAVAEAQTPIRELLNDPDKNVKYASATSLISYRDSSAVPVLKDVLLMSYPSAKEVSAEGALDAQQIADLKMSILNTLQKYNWKPMNDVVKQVASSDTNGAVALLARQVLNVQKE